MSLTYMTDMPEGIVYVILNQRYFQGIKISRHDDAFWAYGDRLERAWAFGGKDLDSDPIFIIQKLYNFGEVT